VARIGIQGHTMGEERMRMQVLLVDDNALQACTRETILSRTGIDVVVAHSAEAALKVLHDDATAVTISLLVTDHLMPCMNGAELARRVRVFLPRLPILVLSGMPDAEAEYAGLDIVFQLKPFPPLDFIRTVKVMLGQQALRSA
jgi:CheY-like chemotaxis protein